MHGLSTAVEHFDSGDGDAATVSTGSTHDSSALRSISTTNDRVMNRLGAGLEQSLQRKNEFDTAGGTTAGIAMLTNNTTSSASPPLPVLFMPVGGGPPILRRNSSSSKDLASLTSSSLVPLDTNTNRSRGPSPDPLTAMMNSVATKLSFEEKSRPPENEEDIDYGESPQGFKPIIQKTTTTTKRRGSKTLGLDAQGGLWSFHRSPFTPR